MTQPTQPTQPTSNELPRELPGREPDDALGAAALDDVRAQIAARVVDTQGAWAAKPAWQRAAPLALATTCAVAWSAWCVSHSSGPSMGGIVAFVAGALALLAVGLAPRTPARAERAALFAIGVAAAACAIEAVTSMRADAPVPGDDVVCARAVLLGGLLPVVLTALHVRLARTPARPHHVAAVAVGGLVASMGAVWTECPATALGHVAISHLAIPGVVAVLLAVIGRSLLRGQ